MLEAGRTRIKEMMMNGGRRMIKPKRSYKKKCDITNITTQGTIKNYFSNNIVGGSSSMSGGQKRKVGARCDNPSLEELNKKRF